jgi:hypothetical protein
MVAAALVAIASPALDWNVVSRAGSTDVLKGTDTSAGLGTLGFGFVLLVVAGFLLLRGGRTGGRAASITGLVVALFILIVNTYSAVAPGHALAWLESEQIAASQGLSEDEVEDVLLRAIERGELEVTAEPGPWVGIVPGVVGTAAGLAGARRSRTIRDQNARRAAAPGWNDPGTVA